MFDDLITHHPPPPNRAGKCEGDHEQHLSEGAVMVAFAMHLLRTVPGLFQVTVHPDGEHGKRFDFQGWLGKRGFAMTAPSRKTTYGGTYAADGGRTIVVDPRSGRGDVVADGEGLSIVAECKGGIINTRHAGALSRLRQGLCETVGLSLASPLTEGRRAKAVRGGAAHHGDRETRAPHGEARLGCGIEIALVDGRGNVFDIAPGSE